MLPNGPGLVRNGMYVGSCCPSPGPTSKRTLYFIAIDSFSDHAQPVQAPMVLRVRGMLVNK